MELTIDIIKEALPKVYALQGREDFFDWLNGLPLIDSYDSDSWGENHSEGMGWLTDGLTEVLGLNDLEWGVWCDYRDKMEKLFEQLPEYAEFIDYIEHP